MSILQEFRTFALKGNVVDMAVGIVIGAAFTRIVNSLVTDIITPVIGAITSGQNFSSYFLWFGDGPKPATVEAAKLAGGGYLAWGSFLQATIDFLIVAAALFAIIKLMNRAREAFERREEAELPPEAPEDIRLLRDIRDALVTRPDIGNT